jgi:hypothetical protein
LFASRREIWRAKETKTLQRKKTGSGSRFPFCLPELLPQAINVLGKPMNQSAVVTGEGVNLPAGEVQVEKGHPRCDHELVGVTKPVVPAESAQVLHRHPSGIIYLMVYQNSRTGRLA